MRINRVFVLTELIHVVDDLGEDEFPRVVGRDEAGVGPAGVVDHLVLDQVRQDLGQEVDVSHGGQAVTVAGVDHGGSGHL